MQHSRCPSVCAFRSSSQGPLPPTKISHKTVLLPFREANIRRHYLLSLAEGLGDDESVLEKRGSGLEVDELSQSYQVCQYLFGVIDAFCFIIPDRTMSSLLVAKLAGAAGFGLAAGLSHILADAQRHHRLSSDTYKRLNLGLLSFSALGLAAVPGETGFLPTAAPAIILTALVFLVRAYSATVAWKGWMVGVVPREGSIARTPYVVFKELRNGTSATLSGLKVQNGKKALTYRNILLFIAVGIVSSLMDGIFAMRVSFAVFPTGPPRYLLMTLKCRLLSSTPN
jgi:hypothetical protein